MTCMEIVILILVSGFVVMLGGCVTVAAISRMIDVKTKARIELTTTLFKNEMDYLDKLFDKYMTRIEKMVDKAVEKKG